jgi:hypothetical protein
MTHEDEQNLLRCLQKMADSMEKMLEASKMMRQCMDIIVSRVEVLETLVSERR